MNLRFISAATMRETQRGPRGSISAVGDAIRGPLRTRRTHGPGRRPGPPRQAERGLGAAEQGAGRRESQSGQEAEERECGRARAVASLLAPLVAGCLFL